MYQIDKAGAMKLRRIELGRRYCILDLVLLIPHQLSIPFESYIEDLLVIIENQLKATALRQTAACQQ